MNSPIGINIEGGKVDSEGVRIVSETVMLILNSPHNDQETKRLALGIIAEVTSAEAPAYTSISNVHVDMTNSSADEQYKTSTDGLEEDWREDEFGII